MNLIACCDSAWGVGKNGGIPWHMIYEDMRRFRKLTMGTTIMMGRRTWESIGEKPLPGRRNIVLSKTHGHAVYEDGNEQIPRNTWIIGGTQVWRDYAPLAKKIDLTLLEGAYDCDTFFPAKDILMSRDWQVGDVQRMETHPGWFVTYEKRCLNATASETGYLALLRDILENGEERNDRTGTGTISVFGRQLRFDISKEVPALTTKALAWKSCVKELLWFMRGSTDVSKSGVKIWDLNSSREFLDKRGLTHLREGDIGAGYGFQWRHFGAEYKGCDYDYTNAGGVDQLAAVLHDLKHDRMSRRIFLSAWNPMALKEMALPPCHVSCQFYVSNDGGLSCHMYQRSVDCFLGLPFNIFSYTVLTYILATMSGLKPKELIISTGDTHIYKNHVEQVKVQLSREPYTPPALWIDPVVKEKSFEEINIDDVKLVGYLSHPAIKAAMSA